MNDYHRAPFLVDGKPTVGGGFNVRPGDPKNTASFRTYNDADGSFARRIADALNAPPTASQAALLKIMRARDQCAEHGHYPDHPDGPDQSTQCFDDWAADLASGALEVEGFDFTAEDGS